MSCAAANGDLWRRDLTSDSNAAFAAATATTETTTPARCQHAADSCVRVCVCVVALLILIAVCVRGTLPLPSLRTGPSMTSICGGPVRSFSAPRYRSIAAQFVGIQLHFCRRLRRRISFRYCLCVSVNKTVMWSETVGLRTRPVSDPKIDLGLGLADLELCCETRSCQARRHNDLEGHGNF